MFQRSDAQPVLKNKAGEDVTLQAQKQEWAWLIYGI